MCADIYNCLSYDIITSTKDAMFFTSVLLFVGWFVGLWAGLHKNLLTDFHETWIEDGSQPG